MGKRWVDEIRIVWDEIDGWKQKTNTKVLERLLSSSERWVAVDKDDDYKEYSVIQTIANKNISSLANMKFIIIN